MVRANPHRAAMIAILILLLSLLTAVARASGDVYVAPNGDDANTGAVDHPLATLQGARDLIRTMRKTGAATGGAIVHIAPGDYRLTRSFELNAADSGQTDAPIVYQGDNAAACRVSGGILVPPAAIRPVTDDAVLVRLPNDSPRDSLVQVDLKALGITDFGQVGPRGFGRPLFAAAVEPFFNDEPMTLARWPNVGEPEQPLENVIDAGSVPRSARSPDRGATIGYTIDRPDRWTTAHDFYITGYFNHGYADDMVRIASLDPQKKTFTTAQPHAYGFHRGKPWNTWVAINLLEELDRPGEYYIDRDRGVLYFLPPAPLAGARLEISTLAKPLVSMTSASFVTFRNLTFECGRDMGFYIEGGEGNRIESCAIRNFGTIGVCVGKELSNLPNTNRTRDDDAKKAAGISPIVGPESPTFDSTVDRNAGHDHRIDGCAIYNTGAGGVSLGGGDRKTLVAGTNTVVDCDIHHVNRWYRTYKAGVYLDGVGNRVEHCHIHDCTGSAIYLHGNDHVVEFCQIDHTVTQMVDMGVFYLGRNPSEWGNVFRHNFVHHCGNTIGMSYVFHLDDGACGTDIIGNVIYACDHASNVNGGYDNRFLNNIFIDNRNSDAGHVGIRAGWDPPRWLAAEHDGQLQQARLLTEVDILSPPYSAHYPDLKRLFEAPPTDRRCNQVWRNVSVRAGTLASSRPDENPPGNDMRDNFESDQDPGFVDAAAMNFQLRPDAQVLRKVPDFEPIPFDRIGRISDRPAAAVAASRPIQ
jgi:hypothetical protein